MNGRQTQGLGLMFTVLGILVLPGLLVNNLQANGMINPSQAQTCSALTDTCTLSASVGCQYSANGCSLAGSAIAILNPCSIFTALLTLNLVGLVQSFFTSCGTAGATAPSSEAVVVANGTALTTINIICSGQYAGEYNGQTGCQGWLEAWPGNGTALQVTCQSTAMVPPNPGYGCLVHPTFTLTDECGSIGPTPGRPFFCETAGGSLFKVPTGVYIPSGQTAYIINGTTAASCPALEPFCQPLIPIGSPGSTLSSNSILTFFLALLGATLLLLLALGVNLSIGGSVLGTGGATAVGSNPQGTKLAQTFGMGLLLFFPLYSEFYTWFGNGYLPFGLDGNLLSCINATPACFTTGGQFCIVSVALIVGFFVGLYMVSQAGSTTS